MCHLVHWDKQLLSRPYTSLVMADKTFSVSAPEIWNHLPLNWRAATCVNRSPASMLITPSNIRSRDSDSVFFWLGLIGALQIGFVLYCIVWRPSVCLSVFLSRCHTHRDSPGVSMRRAQRTFRLTTRIFPMSILFPLITVFLLYLV